MNKIIKRLLLGLLIWAVPFFSSFFVWDVKQNAPSISQDWFNAVMAFTWAIGFAIAMYIYFKDVKKNTVKEGWLTGLTWYAEMVVLDLIFLVGFFEMELTSYFPVLVTYLNTVILSAAIGYMKK